MVRPRPFFAPGLVTVMGACPQPITGKTYLAVLPQVSPNRLNAYLYNDGTLDSTLASGFEHGQSDPGQYVQVPGQRKVFTSHVAGIGSWDVMAGTLTIAPYPAGLSQISFDGLQARGTTVYFVHRNATTNIIRTFSNVFGETDAFTLLGTFDDGGGYESSARLVVTNGAILFIRRRTSDNQAVVTSLPSGPAELTLFGNTLVRGGVQFGAVPLSTGGALVAMVDVSGTAVRLARISDAGVLSELWPASWLSPTSLTQPTASPDGTQGAIYDGSGLIPQIVRHALNLGTIDESCAAPWIAVDDTPLGAPPPRMFALD